MRSRLVITGVLAGGIALTGLAGSAYAASATPAAKTGGTFQPARPVTAKGLIAVVCAGKHVKGMPEKGITAVPEPARLPAKVKRFKVVKAIRGGRALPAPRTGAKATTVIVRKGDRLVLKAPKGLHCTQVKPGVPAKPPAG